MGRAKHIFTMFEYFYTIDRDCLLTGELFFEKVKNCSGN